ncbi:hypothetical protein AHAS_Ahas19G0224300 [Arachis hypogaea]
MLRRGFIGIWWGWGLLVTTRGSTISIGWIGTLEWFLVIVSGWRLLQRGLIKSLWLLPSLIVPSLMQAFIVISSSYNMIVTKFIVEGVRIHSIKRK